MSRTALAIVAVGLFMSVATPAEAQGPVYRSTLHDFQLVTVAEGLVNPWSMAFLPGGDMLITERPGRLRIVRNGTLLFEPVAGVPEVLAQGQGGLLDVMPHPDFASNHLIYLSFSKPIGDGSSATTAVVRGTFQNDSLSNVEEVFLAESRGRGHYGSRLAFDGEGHLFISVGDRQAPSTGNLEAHPAQDRSNNHGTINRINDDGSIPDDNPFVGEPNIRPEIWSYGHRNPQGLIIHPETGDVWATEHGPQGGDELNLIRPGVNYGWPVVGYGVNYGSGEAIHQGTHRDGIQPPLHFWVPSIATAGMTVYTGDKFPAWRGSIFVGGMAGQQLARLAMDGQVVNVEETLLNGLGRIRDVRSAPDGYIYVAVEDRNGNPTSVYRMEPAGAR
jgi:glucose/arabinose dehydrogenase